MFERCTMPRPPTVVCYICHREFGTASIGIHEKSCLKRWNEANNRLPPSERLPEPVKPPGFPSSSSGASFVSPNSGGGGGFVDTRSIKTTGTDPNIEAYNAAAAQTQTLATCPKCGRHFTSDRLAIHKVNCKPQPKLSNRHTYEARKPDVETALLHTPLGGKTSVPKISTQKASGTSGLIACSVCGRTFAPDRIERHQAGCRVTPVQQPSSKSKPAARRRSNSLNHAQRSGSMQPAIVTCDGCGAKAKVGEKFCTRCGTPLPPVCQQCGTSLTSKAKFCPQCGRPVQANKNNTTWKRSKKIKRKKMLSSFLQCG